MSVTTIDPAVRRDVETPADASGDLPAHMRQGGDLRGLPRGDNLDVGTCINHYGPPEAVGQALRDLSPAVLRCHPYDATQVFADSYARSIGTEASLLLPGRGITEFIRLLAEVLPPARTAVVTPDYTDTVRYIPRHVGLAPGTAETPDNRLNRVAAAMAAHGYVVLSNPNNPTGIFLDPRKLAEVCRGHPRSVLVVDEAYIDFTDSGARSSMIHSGLQNLVVLRSPNKPFGIAGVRTGALWSPRDDIRAQVARRQLNWTLSRLDVAAATAAISAARWLQATTNLLRRDSIRLHEALARRFGPVVSGEAVHYRFVALADPAPVYRTLLGQGIVTRLFNGDEPGRIPGLRITTPVHSEIPRLLDVIQRL
jgi:histidinol-phosphate aminotransferase